MKLKPSKTASKATPSQLLTIAKIAELDNCSEKTVRRAIEAGLLEVVRVGPSGRLVRIDPAAHRAYREGYKG